MAKVKLEIAKNPFDLLSAEQQAEYNQLVQAFGTVYIITSDNGATVSFLKDAQYSTYKTIMMMMMQDQTKMAEAGEMLLIECTVGGYDFTTSPNKTRFAAAMKAFETIIEVDDSIEVVKKN